MPPCDYQMPPRHPLRAARLLEARKRAWGRRDGGQPWRGGARAGPGLQATSWGCSDSPVCPQPAVLNTGGGRGAHPLHVFWKHFQTSGRGWDRWFVFPQRDRRVALPREVIIHELQALASLYSYGYAIVGVSSHQWSESDLPVRVWKLREQGPSGGCCLTNSAQAPNPKPSVVSRGAWWM